MRLLCLTSAALLACAGTAMAQPTEWESNFGTGLNQFDDDCDNIALPFAFDYFGTTYNSVWVNSNGNLTFDGCHSIWDWYFDITTPFFYASSALVAPLYLDFNPYSGGDVYWNVTGAPGEQVFVATWSVVPEYAGTPGVNTFQAQLRESGEIVFLYNGLTTDGIGWAGADRPGVVGLSTDTGNPDISLWDYSGTEIPGLDQTTQCYIPDGNGGYDLSTGGCDTDGDGVPNSSDVCPDTVMAESVPTRSLGTNRWALTDDSGDFDTTLPKGNGPGLSFTIQDTAGCSCEQIIDAQGLGNGHTKFGCSISAMQDWIALQ